MIEKYTVIFREMSYSLSILTLKTCFRKTFDSHDWCDIVGVIVKVMHQIIIHDLKTSLKNKLMENEFIYNEDLIGAICRSDPCIELITAISYHYPSHHQKISQYYPQYALLSIEESGRANELMHDRVIQCLLIDRLQSETALRDLDKVVSEYVTMMTEYDPWSDFENRW